VCNSEPKLGHFDLLFPLKTLNAAFNTLKTRLLTLLLKTFYQLKTLKTFLSQIRMLPASFAGARLLVAISCSLQ
jgi:hypothetical protein